MERGKKGGSIDSHLGECYTIHRLTEPMVKGYNLPIESLTMIQEQVLS